jgi:hypothetical protein
LLSSFLSFYWQQIKTTKRKYKDKDEKFMRKREGNNKQTTYQKTINKLNAEKQPQVFQTNNTRTRVNIAQNFTRMTFSG